MHLPSTHWEIVPERPFIVKPAVHLNFVNDVFWPTVDDQEPRTSGVFFAPGMAGYGRKYAFSWQDWLDWADLAVDSLEVYGVSFYNLFRLSVHSVTAAEVDQDKDES